MHNIFLLTGTVLPTLSTVIYLRSIVKGETRPHRTTYALFLAITGLLCVSLVAGHDTSGIWLALASFAQAAVIFGLSLKYGMGGKEPFDIVCLCLCAIGVVAWLASGESIIGVCAAVVADFLALLPALRKMWRYPRTEIWLFYAIDVIASLSIAAAGPFGWRSLLYPLYLASVNALCVAVIMHRRVVVPRDLT